MTRQTAILNLSFTLTIVVMCLIMIGFTIHSIITNTEPPLCQIVSLICSGYASVDRLGDMWVHMEDYIKAFCEVK